MSTAESRKKYAEKTVKGKNETELQNEAELRGKYPDGTVVSVFVDGKWQLAKIVGDVSIETIGKEHKFAANVLFENLNDSSIDETEVVEESIEQDEEGEDFADGERGDIEFQIAQWEEDLATTPENQTDHADNLRRDIDRMRLQLSKLASRPASASTKPRPRAAVAPTGRPIVLNHAPTKLEFTLNASKNFSKPGNSGVDGKKDASLIVTGADVTNDGSPEYTVEAANGDVYEHIPQELLILWRDVQKTEAELTNLEQKIMKDVALSLRAGLLEQVAKAQVQIDLTKKQLPSGVGEMSAYDKTEIDRIKAQLDAVHAKAKESIDRLFSDYSRVFTSATHNANEGNAETSAEREARIKQEEESQKPKQDYIAHIEADIRKGAPAEFQVIDDEEAAALEASIEKAREKHEATIEKAKKAKKSEPPAFDEEAFVASYKPDSKFQAIREALERKMILQIFKNNEANLAALKVTKEDDMADEQVKMDFRFSTALFDKRSALAKKDKITPLAEKESPPNDYLVNDDPDSAYAKATYEAYKQVAKEWKKSAQISEQDSADTEEEKPEFNFDNLINLSWDITDEKRGLLSQIPVDSTTKQPEAAFKDIYAKLKILGGAMKDCKSLYSRPFAELATTKNFTAKKHKVGDEPGGLEYPITNPVELQVFRKAVYTHFLGEYHRFNKRLQSMLISKEHESAKTTKEASKSAEKKEKKVGFVNIPEAVLRENLFSKGGRLGQFKETMRLVYGDVFSKAAGLAPASLEAFKKLLPAKEDEELLKAFAPYGLKDWGEFKAMWDAQMAPRFAEGLRIAADAKFKCKIAKKITWYKQAWAIKGDLAVRIGTTALLVGGAALLSNFAAGAWLGGTATGWGATAALGGAGIGGGLRGWLNEKIFGSKEAKAKMKAKMDTLQQEVEIGSKDTVIEELLNEQFGGAEAKADYKKATASVDLLPQLTAIMAQTIREVSVKQDTKTSDEIKKMDKNDQELYNTLKEMSPEARATYERALLTLEPGDRSDMKLRLKLAVGISKAVGNGDELEKEVLAKMTYESKDGAVMEGLKGFFGGMSGKRGIAVAATTGVALRGAYMAGGYIAGAAVGAGGGAAIGHESAHKEDMEKIRENSRGQLIKTLAQFKNFFEEYPQRRLEPDVDDTYVENARQALLIFKKMLHGDIPPAYAPAFFVDKRYDQFGDLTAARLQLYKQIRVAVLDAEATGILMEGFDKQKERLDANRMGMVLARLAEVKKEVQGDTEEAVTEANIKVMQGALETESKRWTKNKIFRTTYAALAGTIPAAIGFNLKEVWLQPETQGIQGDGQTMQEKFEDLVKAEQRKLTDIKDVADSSTNVAGDSSEPVPDTADTAAVEPELDNFTENEPPANPFVEDGIDKTNWNDGQKAAWIKLQDSLRDLKAREFPTAEPNLIKDDQGPSHTLNRLEATSKHSILRDVDPNWSDEQKAGWTKMQENFHAWREKQLHDIGYRWINGKQVGPLSMRTGDEMKLFWDPKAGAQGEWKARFDNFVYDEKGNPKIELDDKGTPKLDKKGNVIPVDRFKGRVLDHLPRAKVKTANELLQNVRTPAAKAFDPYKNPKFGPDALGNQGGKPMGDGFQPDTKPGAKGAGADMLRATPDIFDTMATAKNSDAAIDALASFAEQYAQANKLNPGNPADVNLFRAKAQEFISDYSSGKPMFEKGSASGAANELLRKLTEDSVAQENIPASALHDDMYTDDDYDMEPVAKNSKLFIQDYAHAGEPTAAGSAASKVAGTAPVETGSDTTPLTAEQFTPAIVDLGGTSADTDVEGGQVIYDKFGTSYSAESIAPNDVWASPDEGYKLTFERRGGSISDMKIDFKDLGANFQTTAESALLYPTMLSTHVYPDAKSLDLFKQLSEYKMVYDDLKQSGSIYSPEGEFVKSKLAEFVRELTNGFGAGKPSEIFKPEFLNELGMETVLKKAA